MTLSEELAWRGFTNQTTYKDTVATLRWQAPITFYWGVDPSADSMTVGNFAVAMMIRHFIDHGHRGHSCSWVVPPA
jgi:tyrosyl-tRNA synthetase